MIRTLTENISQAHHWSLESEPLCYPSRPANALIDILLHNWTPEVLVQSCIPFVQVYTRS